MLSTSLLALAMSPTSALAAEPEAAEEQPTEVSGVVVTADRKDDYAAVATSTATRTPTDLRDVPQSVTVVTRAQLRDQAVVSMAEAVRYVPGLSFAQGEGNRDAPVFRGNTSTSDFFVDGIRDDVQYFRDVYNVDRVEVLRGPNAMIFGRGGAGGVINRVTRQANFRPVHEVHVEVGTDDHLRATFDVGDAVGDSLSLRLTGLYQDSGSYRDGVEQRRWGLNPTLSWRASPDTVVALSVEHFEDERTADRGVPSRNGRPIATDPSTFFGDPDRSFSGTTLDALSAAVEHDFGGDVVLRSRLRLADQEKVYQNVYANGLVAGGTRVALVGYNDATARQSLISQTDLNAIVDVGGMRHVLLAGVELGRQENDNRRLTVFFQNPPASLVCPTPSATQICAPVGAPSVSVPFTLAAAPGNAASEGETAFAAVYLQDQLALTDRLQLVAGVRYDSFEVDFLDRRSGARFTTDDGELSPRVGLIYEPVDGLSLYASYSRTFAPRAGEQLISLNASAAALAPERFENVEVGLKWDPTADFSVTAAAFQLDRSNVVVPDPLNAARSILVDGQRTTGVELSATGRLSEDLSVVAAATWLDAELTADQSATVRAGADLPNTPEFSASAWARYEFTPTWGAALGVIHQGDRYAAADNTVVLPSYTRVDGALYWTVNERAALQLNVENLLDEGYALYAHNNSNITPGSPRAARLGLTLRY